MDNILEEYKNYWEINMFLQTEELDSWALDEAFSGNSDSSSPDGAASSSSLAASKNIVSERNRRKKLNDRLLALRAVVPKISKMDKASIVKDAIEYIQELHEQERRVQAEISELESGKPVKSSITGHRYNISNYDVDKEAFPHDLFLKSKKKKTDQDLLHVYDPPHGSSNLISSSIELLDLTVSYMGEKTMVVSLTCSKRTDTMVKLCQAFESLKLKIITVNLTSVSGRLLMTILIEAEQEEKDDVKTKIETAIAALNDPQSPMSI